MIPGGSEVKESACNVGDLGSIPRSGRSPGEGNGKLLQYSCLENAMDRGGYSPRCCKQSDMTERLTHYMTQQSQSWAYTWRNHTLKRYIHLNVHCSTIYNSQDM